MANYSVNRPKQAAWLIYINGLEIPVISAEVRFGVWAKPTLTLQMVPHPILRRIGAEDRLQVALFYLDTHWDVGNPQFRLMGEFEVVGWGYTTSSRGRSVRLNCVSQMQVFDQLKFYYISSLEDIVTASSPAVATSAAAQQHVKLLYPASLFLEGLTSPGDVAASGTSADTTVAADNFIRRPIDFVLNIFRAHLREVSAESTAERSVPAGSEQLPQSATSVPGKNFFARWFKMTGFHRRWAALPLFEDGTGEDGCFPLVKAVQDTNTLPALQQQIGQSVGDGGSAWSLLQKVLGYMYMEIGVIPGPPAARTERKTGRIKNRDATDRQNTEVTIPTFFVKPMCTFALPPACNVVFPSMIQNLSTEESYIVQPTRLYLGEQFISDILAPQAGSVRNLVQELMVTGYPPPVRSRMQSLVTASPEASRSNFLVFPEEFYKGPISRRLNAPPWMYMLAQQQKAHATQETEEEQKSAINAGEPNGSPLGSLFDEYAKYEFFRARYGERNGGMNLVWNPYIVPGFPVAVFDREGEGFDVMAYANTVTHNFNASQSGAAMTTQVGLTFVRTMAEFLGLVGDVAYDAAGYEEEPQAPIDPDVAAILGEAEDDEVAADVASLIGETGLTSEEIIRGTPGVPDISPEEVIPEVRNIFQFVGPAGELYRRLLYRDGTTSKDTVFNWKTLLNVTNKSGDVLDIEQETWKLDPYVTLTPKEEFKRFFTDYDAAMQFAARPACTLREYIETWHGRPMDELLADGTVKGEYTSFYSPTSDPRKQKGAIFWARIYKLIPGPGDTPPVEVSNIGPAPDYESAGAGNNTFVGPSTGMPQTRSDWDTMLEEYRKIVRSEGGKVAPLT